MKTVVIGAGAIGSLYGGMLADAVGEQVWLVDLWEEHINKIDARGVRFISPTDDKTHRPKAATTLDGIGKADLILVCVKSSDSVEAGMLSEILAGPNTILLTLQNGIGNAEILAETSGIKRILVGGTLMVASILEPAMVWFGGTKPTLISPWGDTDRKAADSVAALLTRVGLPTSVVDDVNSLLWSKLSIHAAFNAITALTRVSSSRFLELEETKRLARLVVDEVMAVAAKKGVRLIYEDPYVEVLARIESLRDHSSFMLLDVMHRRKTEVDTINGSVVREGKAVGVSTPVNETLTLLLEAVEHSY